MQTHLRHVSRGIRVFRPKDRPNAVHALPPTRNLHLLVKLRRLRQIRLLIEIGHAEDVGAALRRSTNQAGGFELIEALGVEVLGKQLARGHAHISNGLLNRRALVHGRVVEVSRHARARHVIQRGGLDRLARLLHVGRTRAFLVVKVDDGLARHGETHAEDLGTRRHAVALGDVQLVGGHAHALDGLQRLLQPALDEDEALERQVADPFHHLLGDGLALGAGGHDALDRPVSLLAQLDKRHLGALHS